ncbi:uncharacterized protein LOC105690672 isoform X1 [Athalia rosae]|uniref:uncharacterized protein LOC105690672 isoform X1 n=1 Tax=Athalia rosae TaxID=37344 RepID=UPI0020341642|nr:uncharacterized protein LOC105690672 isoform X1 [Athalia rosae]
MIFTRYFLTLLGVIALQTIGAECIWRIKRQAGDLGMDVVSCDLADADINRPARCLLSPGSRSFRTRSDADLIAKYFSGNGYAGGLSSLLGSMSPQSKNDNSPGEYVSSSVTASESDSNTVGAPHQDYVGNSMPTNAYTVYSMQPAESILGISPYPYLVGAPSNSYVDNYNTMVGAQNPQFIEHSERNRLDSLIEEDGSQITGKVAAESGDLDDGGLMNAEETNLGAAKDSNILDVADNLGDKNEEGMVVGSEQTE